MPVAAAPIDTGSASMEDRMSAQVSYWLSQKTQNAELTLNTLDGKPVEVQITLKGNEAQVAFRADAGATRELLGSALPQLRELLGSEGLVLSGVTVNDFGARNQSGSGQSGGEEERRPRGGMRQVTAAGDIPAGPARPGGSGLGTGAGRSLDLYV
jgi:flagellar hook-length control protein FliK